MNIVKYFKIMSKPDYAIEPLIAGYGYIDIKTKSVIIKYDIIGLVDDHFNNYEEMIECLPHYCWISFDFENNNIRI